MKSLLSVIVLIIICASCRKEVSQQEKFSTFFNTIPDLKLPFITDSGEDLQAVFYPDTIYNEFVGDNVYGIYGKTKINDSIFGIVYLNPGDIVFPLLVTYNSTGKKIDELALLNLPGGSSGYNANGISYLVMKSNLEIQITDSVNTFERDSLEEIIETSRKTEVMIENYKVNGVGKIIAHD
ncbi:MAG: hypothetical protein IPL10_09655 [Bacteroidetes bacterium]|nr:hypothetical protein [Bacteroidota bacterium]